jgi:hypothetical protein
MQWVLSAHSQIIGGFRFTVRPPRPGFHSIRQIRVICGEIFLTAPGDEFHCTSNDTSPIPTAGADRAMRTPR